MTVKWWQAPDGSASAGRIWFAISISTAIALSCCQVWIYLSGHTGDLTGVILSFLGAGFGGKVGQSFAEKGQ